MVHLGFLKVEGDPAAGLTWTPRIDLVPLDLEAEIKALSEIGEIGFVRVSGHPDSSDGGLTESIRIDSDALTEDDLVKALVKVGYGRREAGRRMRQAKAKLAEAGEELTDEGSLLESFRAAG